MLLDFSVLLSYCLVDYDTAGRPLFRMEKIDEIYYFRSRFSSSSAHL